MRKTQTQSTDANVCTMKIYRFKNISIILIVFQVVARYHEPQQANPRSWPLVNVPRAMNEKGGTCHIFRFHILCSHIFRFQQMRLR